MGDKTKIEWTDASWTPIRGRYWENAGNAGGKERIGWHCEHVSEGCRNCYAEGMNLRLGTGQDFKPGNLFRQEKVGYNNGEVKIFLDDAMLTQPMRWKRQRRIFVCSMTDLFASFVPDDFIDRMFAVMALCPQHTFQILTKRPDRMREYLTGPWQARIMDSMRALQDLGPGRGVLLSPRNAVLRNVWAGTSVEDQKAADARIPQLLATPAAIRFLSCEPLLGPVNLKHITVTGELGAGWFDALAGWRDLQQRHPDLDGKIDWVIAGGESGRWARPMHPAWPRSLRDQCAAADVPFHFKQWGAWANHTPVAGGDLSGDVRRGRVMIVHPTGQSDVEVSDATGGRNTIPGSRYMERVGNDLAGRMLDGIEHNGFPA